MILLIHTSTPTARIGLAESRKIVARDEFPIDTTFASVLADRIRQFLAASTQHLAALKRIIVHAGPGGFTSLRVGVTTANALGYALGIPVIGVTGPANNLDDLLAQSAHAAPAAHNLVVPVYSKPPNIGPIPR